jgi:hypothetical protein
MRADINPAARKVKSQLLDYFLDEVTLFLWINESRQSCSPMICGGRRSNNKATYQVTNTSERSFLPGVGVTVRMQGPYESHFTRA